MRDLATVIEQMKFHIPVIEVSLLTDLKDILNSIPYSPPEDWLFCWERTQYALMDTIGDFPTEDWQFQVISIWTTKSINELRSEALEYERK